MKAVSSVCWHPCNVALTVNSKPPEIVVPWGSFLEIKPKPPCSLHDVVFIVALNANQMLSNLCWLIELLEGKEWHGEVLARRL